MEFNETTRAAIYCRISDDRNDDELGVKRQEFNCRRLAADHGLVNIEVYVDNDISASRFTNKARPAFERLVAAIDTGQVDVVLVSEPPRLYRRPKELERFIDVCSESRDVPTLTVERDRMDLSSPHGRAMARMSATMAALESDQKSARIRRKHEELAREGVWMSGPRCYGYEAVFALNGNGKREISEVRVVATEADVIREAVTRLMAGDLINAIVSDFNRRGIPAAKGGIWRPVSLRQIVCAARNAGLREHTPGKRGSRFPSRENITEGSWEPIISHAQWTAMQVLFSDPARRSTRPGAWLLTAGIGVCGLCGHHLRRGTRAGKPLLVCHKYGSIGGCGKIAVTMSHVDGYVSGVVVSALLRAEVGGPDVTVPDESVILSLKSARQRLEQAQEDCYVLGVLPRDRFLAEIKPKIEAQILDLRARLDAPEAHLTALDGLPSTRPALESWWAAQSLERRKAVIRSLVVRVEIHKPTTPRGSNQFDPNRVRIVWRRPAHSAPVVRQ
ncbi:recombinase family protein [Aeromicrobium ginsengisoli]|nr:recombinase family protein [Aeromicrobium ginsengisoli]